VVRRSIKVRFVALLSMMVACDANPGGVPRPHYTEAQAAAARAACEFHAGDMPAATLAQTAPIGSQIPIDTIVVVMMENRSFDHMLGNLPAYGQPNAEVAPPNASNPDGTGGQVAWFHQTDLCFPDILHSWAGGHAEYADGRNDGFVAVADPAGERAMGYYTEQELPFFYAAASTFAIADHYHGSLLGPTHPNRMYLYAGTSFGHIYNTTPLSTRANIMEVLSAHQVAWRVYAETDPGLFLFGDSLNRFHAQISKLPAFFEAARLGTLEHVVFVDPDLDEEYGGGDDLHPPDDIQRGDEFVSRVAQALIASPQWRRTALFITFDEWGGLYDHVPPPAACRPDDIEPMLMPGDPPGHFDRLGFRVPLLAISPWSKPHYVSHHVYDHTSILRFIETRFSLPAFTARDANADPLLDLFDFREPALLAPPALPQVTVDAQKLAECVMRFPNQ
jgi:phospholipase C